MTMYTHVFGLTRPPFERGLESHELFRAPMLDELHSRLRHLVDSRALGLITGEPGCGKSTALRCLAGLERPEQGRIRCGDQTWYDDRAGVCLRPQARRITARPDAAGSKDATGARARAPTSVYPRPT